MNAQSDLDLLREYAISNSESAFSALVKRHIGLVYSAALRQVRDPHLAEDVTQAVFIILARKTKRIRPGTSLSGWLFRTARFASADALKIQYRRRRREQEAAQMDTTSIDTSSWNQVAPLLDEAISQLREKDRTAVLLRFFENKSLNDVGAALGISEDSARMRVSRAVERLRSFFTRRGTSLSAIAIGALLSANAVQAAPHALVGSVASGALKGGLAGASTLTIVKGALNAMTWIKVKTVAAFSAVMVLAAGTATVVVANRQPDPVDLLRQVAQGREKIVSGEMEIDWSHYEEGYEGLRLRLDGTNRTRLKVQFTGDKRRHESSQREYAYVLMGPHAAEVTDAKRLELGLDHEASERAGLLNGFEAHHVRAYDGTAVLDYETTDNIPFQTKIEDPVNAGSYLFNPRCLGIHLSQSADATVENCLGYRDPMAVELVGKETVEGIAAWHIRVQRGLGKRDFWVEADKPTRVIKHAYNGSVEFSKYDDANPQDPLPIEVRASHMHGTTPGGPVAYTQLHFVRRSARFNTPIVPESWTLAGLGMQRGTEVVDYRSNRLVGYWDGTGLSQNAFPTARRNVESKLPTARKLLALVEKDPKSPFALEASSWVMLNTPDGSDVDKAAEIIVKEHLRSPDLVYLCNELRRLRLLSSRKLLEAVLESNPSAEVQAHACFALATLLKIEANKKGDEQATTKATLLLERIISDYPSVAWEGMKLSEHAKPELNDLRRFGIGKEAPEIEGQDFDGQQIRLSDYRGQVVLLNFWGTWCGPCMAKIPEERKLVERMAGKPFALIGINSDSDVTKVKRVAEKENITWRSFRDGGSRGPIARAWNVQDWPTLYILDRNGIIRYRDVWGPTLAEAVDTVMRE